MTQKGGITKKEKIKLLTEIIRIVDGYRIGRCEDFRWITSKLQQKKIDKKIYCEWRTIQDILFKLAKPPEKMPKIPTLIKIRRIVAYSSLIFPTFFLVIFFSQVLSKKPFVIPSSITIIIAYLAIVTFLLVPIFSSYIDYKISKMMDKYLKDHPRKYRIKLLKLKTFVQFLINELRNLETSREEFKKLRIKLFNVDYNGIKILKKPRAWRKFYICSVIKTINEPRYTHNKLGDIA